MRETSGGLAFFRGLRLEPVQESDGALRMGSGREDRSLIAA